MENITLGSLEIAWVAGDGEKAISTLHLFYAECSTMPFLYFEYFDDDFYYVADSTNRMSYKVGRSNFGVTVVSVSGT